jgi:hypothetical protein
MVDMGIIFWSAPRFRRLILTETIVKAISYVVFTYSFSWVFRANPTAAPFVFDDYHVAGR